MTADDDSVFKLRYDSALEDFMAGRLAHASLSLQELQKVRPNAVEVLELLGVIAAQLKQSERALDYFGQAIRLMPQQASHHANYGNVLFDLNRWTEATVAYREAIKLQPDFAEAYHGLGRAQQKLGENSLALASYDRAIELKSDWTEPFISKGNLLEQMGRDAEAMVFFAQALTMRPGYASALMNVGSLFLKQKNYQAALDSFKTAIKFNPTHYDAYMQTADLLIRLNYFKEAQAVCEQAIQFAPKLPRAYYLMGISYYKRVDLEHAVKNLEKAVQLEADAAQKAIYYNAIGACLNASRHPQGAIKAFRLALEVDPTNWSAQRNLGDTYYINEEYDSAFTAYAAMPLALQPAGLKQYIKSLKCEWAEYERLTKDLIEKLSTRRLNGRTEDPWHLQRVSDSAALAYEVATNFKLSDKDYDENFLGPLQVYPRHKKIRVGFFSPDLKEHPVSHLLLGVLRNLNRDKFELYAFSYGVIGPGDTLRPELQKLFSEFIDINSMHDAEVARKARQLEIDIAIDLAGVTSQNRHAIFGYRAAPVQVNYLGYAGTIGDDTEEYIIADSVVIPSDKRQYFHEKVVSLPCYMPFDDQVGGTQQLSSREDVGLPKDGFIFSCFNYSTKITPEVFDSWMRILHAVPHSYLWLSQRLEVAIQNLTKEAEARGIKKERIIFAPKIRDMQSHLARQQHVDLFLDTFPYNAHTTAADVLWAGSPILTRAGESMPSRVAASLLTSLGLSELVTTSSEQYEAAAIDLATHPEKLAALRAKLAQNRLTSPLFNTKLYTAHFEAALTAMYERSQAGLPPDHIEIKA